MAELVYNKCMKIGIYGGAFDPVHKEHKKIIEKSYIELGLNKLILLPSYSPPHKNNKFSPFNARVNMLKAETKELDFIEIDERELYRNKGTNCAYEVLQEIRNENAGNELIYIIGGDSIINFHTWVHPEIISKTVPIAVVAREGYENLIEAVNTAIRNYGANIKILSFKGENISSSIVKANYEFGKSSPHVTKEVNDIIIKEKLYRDFEYYINKMKNSVSRELFEHCKSTVYYALKLSAKLDLNFEEVFLAALLHDCAKEITPNSKQYNIYPHKIVHQYYGASIAEKEYGITNEKILNAIRFHTTGKKDMSQLEKLIYCADMLEQNRDFEGVEGLREIIEKDFEKGFVKCVEASIKRLEQTKRDIYYLTRECYDYYNK